MFWTDPVIDQQSQILSETSTWGGEWWKENEWTGAQGGEYTGDHLLTIPEECGITHL